MTRKLKYRIGMMALALALLTGCAIENDIPYPTVEAAITAIAVEGQRAAEGETNAAATIDNTAHVVTLYVNDSVDVSRLRITQLALNPTDVELTLDSALCDDAERFPFGHFASLDSVPASANTRVDFSSPVTFTLRKYADYPWKVTVNQIIQRDIEADGMTRHVLDADSRTVIIYMNPKTFDAENVNIKTLNLGGEYGEVTPDPTTVHDFTTSQTFLARLNWEPEGQFREWHVYVYPDPESGNEATGDVFAMVSRAIINGSVTSGRTPTVEYKEQNASTWQTVDEKNMEVKGGKFTATLTGLTGSTTYNYRVSVDGVPGAEQSFTTVAAAELPNGSLDSWSEGALQASGNKYYIPNAEGEDFWGTGNSATALYKTNVTSPTSDSYSGQAAELKSQNALNVKMAAGNLFTGTFERKGMDGELLFGREFTSFPTGLRFYYKYTTAPMQTTGVSTVLTPEVEKIVGQPDSCHVYIALADKPYEVRTNPQDRQLFDKTDAGIIAYGEFVSAKNVSSYEPHTIDLVYRDYRTPKYLIIVCSSSKYGDYYLAGEGSTLWLDEMELIYE